MSFNCVSPEPLVLSSTTLFYLLLQVVLLPRLREAWELELSYLNVLDKKTRGESLHNEANFIGQLASQKWSAKKSRSAWVWLVIAASNSTNDLPSSLFLYPNTKKSKATSVTQSPWASYSHLCHQSSSEKEDRGKSAKFDRIKMIDNIIQKWWMTEESSELKIDHDNELWSNGEINWTYKSRCKFSISFMT